MLYWALMFFVIALVAALFGFGGIASGAAWIAKVLFVGFLVLATLRAAGAVPASWIAPTRLVSTYLTIVAMAGLGLSADVRTVAKAGSRVVAAVSLSLLVLIGLGIGIISVLRIR